VVILVKSSGVIWRAVQQLLSKKQGYIKTNQLYRCPQLQLQQNASTSILDQNLPGLHTLRKDFILRSDYDDGDQMQLAGNKENVIDTWSVTAVILGR
jgi:hypothetical protein